MGRRGPAKKPTALKLVEGETRPSRINANEPIPPQAEVLPPPDLSQRALAEWERLAPDLIAKHVLTTWDRDAFGAYCEAVADRAAAASLVKTGLLVKGRNGEFVTNPAWRIYRDSTTAMLRFAQEFGLTPAARGDLKIGEASPEELFDIMTPKRVRGPAS